VGNDIYSIEMLSEGFSVRLNPLSVIFAGHFPGNPILPGVIQVKIAVECAGMELGHSVQLKELIQAKFLQYVDPRVNGELLCRCEVRPEETGYKVNAVISTGDVIFSKLLFTCSLLHA
jgi:3-hydroxyacyl-[acyl-carrier-protein] dehydratase